jgi:acyl carrier protein phosphodiesterase
VNFLAHLYLSGDDQKIQLGNFIGDFVKGRPEQLDYDREIVRGIELHRAIDEYTDSHPIVLESKVRLRPKYRHYSSVIVDVYYDHFLAKNWHDYHEELLPEYADKVYGMVEKNLPILPKQVQRMLPYMIRGNWLVNYAQIEGIHRALYGMASRSKYDSKMDEASEDLREHYNEFYKEFAAFFPELSNYCKGWLNESS